MDLRRQTQSLFQIGAGLVVSLLVMTGIAVTIYKVVAPGGWVAQAFGQGFKAGLSVLLALALLLAFAYFSRTWSPSHGHRNFTANVAVGLFALAGFVYLARFWTSGAL